MPNPDPTPQEQPPQHAATPSDAAATAETEADTGTTPASADGEGGDAPENTESAASASEAAASDDAQEVAVPSEGSELDPLAEAERQRDEYLDLLRRERAEFENFRRRSAKERAEALDRGAELLVSQLLGVLDNFGYVLDAASASSDESLSKGAEMVHAELMAVLERAGLQRVPGAGEVFDPTHHEAMMQVEADEPVDHPVVAEVLRPGYRFKERVLRPASVSVAQ